MCGSGGIGRRAGFRVQWEQSCGGSSPPFRTNNLAAARSPSPRELHDDCTDRPESANDRPMFSSHPGRHVRLVLPQEISNVPMVVPARAHVAEECAILVCFI